MVDRYALTLSEGDKMVKISNIVGSFGNSSPVQNVKKYILDWFRKNNCDVGHVIAEQHIFHMSISWNPKEKNALSDAIDELKKEGLVEDHENGLALTKEGVDYIY